MPTYLAPLLAVFVSLAAAIISYYNYTLNKTLNIKNQLFNEKLRKYIELSRKLAEFIELLDQAGPTLNQSQHDGSVKALLLEQAGKADGLGKEIEYLVIDAHMLVPEKVIGLLMDFVSNQNIGGGGELSRLDRESYWKNDKIFRSKAEALILAFREDLQVEKLSFSLNSKKTVSHGQKD
jgi:hypothetical protein